MSDPSPEEQPEFYKIAGQLHSGLTYWQVVDLPAVYRRFIDLGSSVIKPIRRDGQRFMGAVVDDPWGNKIGLYSFPFVK